MRIVDYFNLISAAIMIALYWQRGRRLKEQHETIKIQAEVIDRYPATMAKAHELCQSLRARAEIAEVGLYCARQELKRFGVEMVLERMPRKPDKELS